MYAIATQIELGLLFLLLAVSAIAALKASGLLYDRPVAKLRRKAQKLRFWAILVSLPAVMAAAAVVYMVFALEPVFWLDRLLLHVPLLLIPAASIWLLSVPRLRRLLLAADDGMGDPQDWSRRASDPGIAGPFRWMLLGALGAFYFSLRPPVPFEWTEAAVPLVAILGAAALLWFPQAARHRAANRPGGGVSLQPGWVHALRRLSMLLACAGIAVVPFSLAMQNSRLPDHLAMAEGPADFGTGAALAAYAGHEGHSGHDGLGASQTAQPNAATPVSVTELTGPRAGKPDRTITLTAMKKTVRLSSGKTVDAWTFNGQIPGPEIRLREGELVEVKLVNKDIEQGATIHWHGLDVPNAEDGVAGATQDAVMPGETHTYRFRAEQVGTFWYHSHQNSREAVSKGLFGPLIVEPNTADARKTADITVMTHLWDGTFAIGDADGIRKETIAPGTPVRLRLINTVDWVRQRYELAGTSFRVTAIDGTELNDPGELTNVRLTLTTGGRYDIAFTMPHHPVFLRVGGNDSLGVLMSPDGVGDAPAVSSYGEFDPLHYGRPAPVAFGPDSDFDREFTMLLDNKLGFYDGQFEMLYTMNGHVFPDTPMFMVREGELVKTTIVNRGAVDHPMHLHGHHMLVLSRNGERASGSPWWSDTLDVQPGDVYEVAFKADNPGIWMDHCHNLTHAAIGMTMHLMYEGVTTPFEVGRATGNHPE